MPCQCGSKVTSLDYEVATVLGSSDVDPLMPEVLSHAPKGVRDVPRQGDADLLGGGNPDDGEIRSRREWGAQRC